MDVNRKIFLPGLILAPVAFIYFLIQIRLDPNPHHDGIILSAGIASSEGLVSNRDFFNQYGPLVSILDGIWLRMTSPTLYQLRMLNSFLLVVTGILMYWLLARKLKSYLSFVLTLLWIVTAPYYLLPVSTPWPSVITNLLLLTAMAVAVVKPNLVDSPGASFAISFILTLGVLCRVQSGASLLMLMLAYVMTKKYRVAVHLCYGAFSGLLLIVLYFSLTKSFVPWMNDCLIWAVNRYGSPQTISKAWLVDTLLWLYFPVIFFFWIALVKLYSFSRFEKVKISTLVVSLSSVGFFSTFDVDDKSYLNPVYLITASSQNWLAWLGYVSAFSVLVAILILLTKRNSDPKYLAVLILGSSALIQLYPAHDAFHLWWITPCVVVASVYFWSEWINSYVKTISIIGLLSLLIALLAQLDNFQSPRVGYQSVALIGTQGDPDLVRFIDSTAVLLKKVPRNQYINYDCVDGLYSVINGYYSARNENMVNWGRPNQPIESNRDSYRFTCYTTAEQEREYKRNSYEIVGKVKSKGGLSNILWKRP